jgi:hypothetical protein
MHCIGEVLFAYFLFQEKVGLSRIREILKSGEKFAKIGDSEEP